MGEEDIPKVVDDSANRATTQKSLESLLFDESPKPQSVNFVVQQSSQVIGDRRINHFGSLIMLLLLFSLLFGAGYYYLTFISASQLPATQAELYVSPMIPVPARLESDIPVAASDTGPETPLENVETTPLVTSLPVEGAVPLFTVAVGPFVNDVDLQQAIVLLEELGLQPQKVSGRGLVTMIRLLEGVYPVDEARIRLAELKEIDESAFLLPLGDKLAVYAGSFHRESWAKEMQNDLASHMVNVALVESEITMNGTLLTVLQADQQTANEMAAHISGLGLHTQLLTQK